MSLVISVSWLMESRAWGIIEALSALRQSRSWGITGSLWTMLVMEASSQASMPDRVVSMSRLTSATAASVRSVMVVSTFSAMVVSMTEIMMAGLMKRCILATLTASTAQFALVSLMCWTTTTGGKATSIFFVALST